MVTMRMGIVVCQPAKNEFTFALGDIAEEECWFQWALMINYKSINANIRCNIRKYVRRWGSRRRTVLHFYFATLGKANINAVLVRP